MRCERCPKGEPLPPDVANVQNLELRTSLVIIIIISKSRGLQGVLVEPQLRWIDRERRAIISWLGSPFGGDSAGRLQEGLPPE